MKTYRSTVNRFLLYALVILSIAVAAISLPQLQSYRESLSAALGLPLQFLPGLTYALALAFVALLAGNLHARLSKPIREVADQCASGQLANPRSTSRTREMRIIKEYIRQVQDRADQRSDQIQRMEQELIATRKERDRSFRKMEEYEDLLSSYNRIRSELDIDNKALRQDNRELNAENDILRQELRDRKKRPSGASLEFLNELKLNAKRISGLSNEIAKQWEKRSLSSIRESLFAISEKCEQQIASIEDAALMSEVPNNLAPFPIQNDLQRILNGDHSQGVELSVADDRHLIENSQDERTITFLRSFTQLVSEQVDQGQVDIRIEDSETQQPSLSLTVQSSHRIEEALNPQSVSELARQHGVVTDAIDVTENELRLTFPLPQLQVH